MNNTIPFVALAEAVISSKVKEEWACPKCNIPVEISFYEHKDGCVSAQIVCNKCNDYYHTRGRFKIPDWWFEMKSINSRQKQ